jgi:hypothetical protein
MFISGLGKMGEKQRNHLEGRVEYGALHQPAPNDRPWGDWTADAGR